MRTKLTSLAPKIVVLTLADGSCVRYRVRFTDNDLALSAYWQDLMRCADRVVLRDETGTERTVVCQNVTCVSVDNATSDAVAFHSGPLARFFYGEDKATERMHDPFPPA